MRKLIILSLVLIPLFISCKKEHCMDCLKVVELDTTVNGVTSSHIFKSPISQKLCGDNRSKVVIGFTETQEILGSDTIVDKREYIKCSL